MGQMINAFKYFKHYHAENDIGLVLYMAPEDKSRRNVWKLERKVFVYNIGRKLLTIGAINNEKDYPVRQ